MVQRVMAFDEVGETTADDYSERHAAKDCRPEPRSGRRVDALDTEVNASCQALGQRCENTFLVRCPSSQQVVLGWACHADGLRTFGQEGTSLEGLTMAGQRGPDSSESAHQAAMEKEMVPLGG